MISPSNSSPGDGACQRQALLAATPPSRASRRLTSLQSLTYISTYVDLEVWHGTDDSRATPWR
jgi:hypothetical protein